MSKETFKSFARLHPELVKSVMSNKTSWQQLYELYEIYGEDSTIWNTYFYSDKESTNPTFPDTFKDLLATIKNLDMESVQKGISNIQKTIGLLQDIGIGSRSNDKITRPIYKRFED